LDSICCSIRVDISSELVNSSIGINLNHHFIE
jgi:hypothetical protein